MNKKHYIELAKDFIDKSMGGINDPERFDFTRERSQLTWETSKRWLHLLNSNEASAEDVENLLSTIYAFEISQLQKPVFISRLFAYVYIWAKERNLLTRKSREMMQELSIAVANSIDQYYDGWIDPPDKHVALAISIVKRWINLINSDVVTQEDVNSIIDKIISYNTMAGSMFSGLTSEFRLWAEVEGFNVLSEKKLIKHFERVSEDFVKKILAEMDK